MKTIIFTALLATICTASLAEMGYVDSYYRRDGTYVQGHYKDISADGNPYNNRIYTLGY
jgi:hypothetical protein